MQQHSSPLLPGPHQLSPAKDNKPCTNRNFIPRMNESTKFTIYALGIFVSYFYFGILQEKITRGRYGDEVNEDGTVGQRFTFMLALVGIQCFVNWFFAHALLRFYPSKQMDVTPAKYYVSCSTTYLLAMISSNMALRWVPYPTQVVGKSAKPIPVMILGILIGNKTYSMKKYICVLLIVVGVVLFMMKDGKTNAEQDSSGIGELLLIMSLLMDGLTAAIQDRVRAISKPSGPQMMQSMNGWSTLMLLVALIVTGQGMDFVKFSIAYTSIWRDLPLLALTGAIGQLFIFMMVSSFGPLSCSVVTTTRKFFTVLCSVVLFNNQLAARQWLGACIVFSGLFADVFFGKKNTDPKKTDLSEKK